MRVQCPLASGGPGRTVTQQSTDRGPRLPRDCSGDAARRIVTQRGVIAPPRHGDRLHHHFLLQQQGFRCVAQPHLTGTTAFDVIVTQSRVFLKKNLLEATFWSSHDRIGCCYCLILGKKLLLCCCRVLISHRMAGEQRCRHQVRNNCGKIMLQAHKHSPAATHHRCEHQNSQHSDSSRDFS